MITNNKVRLWQRCKNINISEARFKLYTS